jgi:hypothetical protein
MATFALSPVPAVFFSALHLKKSIEKALASGDTVLSVKNSNDEVTNAHQMLLELQPSCSTEEWQWADICMEAHHSKKDVNIYVKVAEKLRETAGLQEAHCSKKHVGQVECWEHSNTNDMHLAGDQAAAVIVSSFSGHPGPSSTMMCPPCLDVPMETSQGKKKTKTRTQGSKPWARHLRQRL